LAGALPQIPIWNKGDLLLREGDDAGRGIIIIISKFIMRTQSSIKHEAEAWEGEGKAGGGEERGREGLKGPWCVSLDFP